MANSYLAIKRALHKMDWCYWTDEKLIVPIKNVSVFMHTFARFLGFPLGSVHTAQWVTQEKSNLKKAKIIF